jgi:DNA mismatch repair protein MutL
MKPSHNTHQKEPSPQPRIHHLSTDVIAKIAAGEVADRPSSIIKELIENALDAGATDIMLRIEDGGLKKIWMKDNGHGMSRADIELAALPHTTSKIVSEHDLASIGSFGFRGEALASIAAVSQLSIKSRERDAESGYEILIDHGSISPIVPVGLDIGTEITITDLFGKIPARKKFIKEGTAEVRAIVELCTRFSLAFPNVTFSVEHNNNYLFNELATNDRATRISHIFERYTMLPIDHHEPHVSLSGSIASPQSANARPVQYVYVNNRMIAPTFFQKIATAAFSSLIEPRTAPSFVFFVSVPSEQVDVNIHPRKEEVSFAHTKAVEQAVRTAIEHALEKHALTYTYGNDTFETYKDSQRPSMDRESARQVRAISKAWNLKANTNEPILQIDNLYLIAESDTGLILIDQHAAHERILYEQFKEHVAAIAADKKIHTLVEPVLIHLTPSESVMMEQEIEKMTNLGFDIEQFGIHSYKINAVPEFFKNRSFATLIPEVLSDLYEGRKDTLDRETNRTLAYLACRSAIKSGDPLDQAERKRLVEKLLATPGSYTCPHGRPTHIEISRADLGKLFKRI